VGFQDHAAAVKAIASMHGKVVHDRVSELLGEGDIHFVLGCCISGGEGIILSKEEPSGLIHQ
jgi:hypothetical protein